MLFDAPEGLIFIGKDGMLFIEPHQKWVNDDRELIFVDYHQLKSFVNENKKRHLENKEERTNTSFHVEMKNGEMGYLSIAEGLLLSDKAIEFCEEKINKPGPCSTENPSAKCRDIIRECNNNRRILDSGKMKLFDENRVKVMDIPIQETNPFGSRYYQRK